MSASPSLVRMCAPLGVWALHFVVVYSLQGLACARDIGRAPVAGLDATTWSFVLLTVLALAVIAALGLQALRAWRAQRPADSGRATSQRNRFLTAVTALSAVLAAIAVVFTALPIALLPTC